MKKIQTLLFVLGGMASLVIALVSVFPIQPVQAAGDAIVVMVNASNPVENLSLSELKKLFMSDRSKWDSGRAVAPVMVSPGAPERTAFLKIVCGMNDAEFGKYFLQAAFNGKSATPPKEVSSGAAVKSNVGNSPGAIGFVKASEFPSGNPTVKAVKIDGAAAGEPGYKLNM
jgi:ABC-type phosphate transport system substrate-binding protein